MAHGYECLFAKWASYQIISKSVSVYPWMSVASELIIESIFAQWTAVSAEACNWSKRRE